MENECPRIPKLIKGNIQILIYIESEFWCPWRVESFPLLHHVITRQPQFVYFRNVFLYRFIVFSNETKKFLHKFMKRKWRKRKGEISHRKREESEHLLLSHWFIEEFSKIRVLVKDPDEANAARRQSRVRNVVVRVCVRMRVWLQIPTARVCHESMTQKTINAIFLSSILFLSSSFLSYFKSSFSLSSFLS